MCLVWGAMGPSHLRPVSPSEGLLPELMGLFREYGVGVSNSGYTGAFSLAIVISQAREHGSPMMGPFVMGTCRDTVVCV